MENKIDKYIERRRGTYKKLRRILEFIRRGRKYFVREIDENLQYKEREKKLLIVPPNSTDGQFDLKLGEIHYILLILSHFCIL